jgi:hypothetical protein
MTEQKKWKGGAMSGIYCLATIGALVYYYQRVNSLQEGLIGFLKALIWPALLAYKALEFFNL